jgi:hypothetical protein
MKRIILTLTETLAAILAVASKEAWVIGVLLLQNRADVTHSVKDTNHLKPFLTENVIEAESLEALYRPRAQAR